MYSIYTVYDKDHLSVLQIKNTSERDPHGCEVDVELEQLQRKLRKNCDSISNGIQTHDLRDGHKCVTSDKN